MKQITLNIPDSKYQFFMELIHQLGFDKAEEIDIPDGHKAIVRERIKNSNPEELIPWQEARKQLRFKKT
ncbi:hypothetical protein FNH22_05020 [Fulvivirga sp. M361]|uniref:hypothetical protein n=1 Tax=Fulvivirga sp. M361 TaxID=2594266 RepID=UPI00117ABE20|nr:hypothetical protein [Fulvivirga sp. M361]TRX61420.1 hypothetical protein FNH22_05020 [Fulvivirga sp. M361]